MRRIRGARPSVAEAEVRALVGELFARAAGDDPGAVAALFCDDEDITFWGSEQDEAAVGPEAVRAFTSALVERIQDMSVAWAEERVRVAGEVAWVNAAGDSRGARTTAAPGRSLTG
jgi:ketosteroid isomerase-like protein